MPPEFRSPDALRPAYRSCLFCSLIRRTVRLIFNGRKSKSPAKWLYSRGKTNADSRGIIYASRLMDILRIDNIGPKPTVCGNKVPALSEKHLTVKLSEIGILSQEGNIK
jgi:hypothetical protein